MAAASHETLTTGTLEGLETRLRRLENIITGGTAAAAGSTVTPDGTVTKRLDRLEASLNELSVKSPVVREFLDLYKAHPDFFPPTGALPPSNSFTTREQLATVNASATAYPSTASQLTSIQDSPIPSAESSASLIALQPRLAAVEHKQTEQKQKLADLRLRSAKVLERWYDITIMGSNECWAEWDEKLMATERSLRQEEARRERATQPI